jgi:AcrR family transcriptional regulator
MARRSATSTLLDVATEVLVADPAASLADVAEAAGLGRTTLHKHYATRDDLMRAVAHRALDLWSHAIDNVADDSRNVANRADGGLRALTEATIPIGPQLGFLWRSPILDHIPEIVERWIAVEHRNLAVLQRARAGGVIDADVPDWWLLQTFYSVVYVASEAVRSGHLAPRDAPDLVLRTMLRGIGDRSLAYTPPATTPPATTPPATTPPPNTPPATTPPPNTPATTTSRTNTSPATNDA